MYERLNRSTGSALAYRITRPLDGEEMRQITDELTGTISARGKIRLLIDLRAFPYNDLDAFWEDLKFDIRHAGDLERLALVGGGEMEKWATRIFGLFTRTQCRCFGTEKLDSAWNWLTGD